MAAINSALKKFSIVEFSKEQSVEVIASCWIKGDRKSAYWPRFKTTAQYRKAVLEASEPNTKKWELVEIRFMKTTG